jgi:hypothetical protein
VTHNIVQYLIFINLFALYFFFKYLSLNFYNFFYIIIFFAISTEVINNLQNQIKLYQQMFEQLESGSASASPVLQNISTNNIVRSKQRYFKSEDILKLFKISKAEYNNILVRIN